MNEQVPRKRKAHKHPPRDSEPSSSSHQHDQELSETKRAQIGNAIAALPSGQREALLRDLLHEYAVITTNKKNPAVVGVVDAQTNTSLATKDLATIPGWISGVQAEPEPKNGEEANKGGTVFSRRILIEAVIGGVLGAAGFGAGRLTDPYSAGAITSAEEQGGKAGRKQLAKTVETMGGVTLSEAYSSSVESGKIVNTIFGSMINQLFEIVKEGDYPEGVDTPFQRTAYDLQRIIQTIQSDQLINAGIFSEQELNLLVVLLQTFQTIQAKSNYLPKDYQTLSAEKLSAQVVQPSNYLRELGGVVKNVTALKPTK